MFLQEILLKKTKTRISKRFKSKVMLKIKELTKNTEEKLN